MSLLLELRDIHVSYDETEIVHGVDLQLHEGQLCALLGLNGSGKTTLLRGLCGLIPATGEALVTGQNLRVLNERERAKLVSFIPQTASAIFGKTVMEVKFRGAVPLWFCRVMSDFGLSFHTFSKCGTDFKLYTHEKALALSDEERYLRLIH